MGLGLKWNGALQSHKYLIAESSKPVLRVDDLEWHPLDEMDSRFEALLLWVYNYHVVFPSPEDTRVCCHEEVVFTVSGVTLDPLPGCQWGLQVDVFSIWDQSDLICHFLLADDK